MNPPSPTLPARTAALPAAGRAPPPTLQVALAPSLGSPPAVGFKPPKERSLTVEGRVGSADVLRHLFRMEAVRGWLQRCFARDGIEIQIQRNLSEGLRNGVLLCFLVQSFEARSVPRVHETPAGTAEYRENVVFFLAACEMIGVARAHLFRVNDLVDDQSMVNVVECLVALADAVKLRWPGKFPDLELVDPIPPSTEPAALELLAAQSHEELAAIARQLVTRLKASSMRGSIMTRLTQGYRLSFVDKGREVAAVVADKHEVVERGMRRLLAVWRASHERQRYQTRLRDSAYRERVVFEILSTERTYVESLQCCIDVYLRPLEAAVAANRPILSADKVAAIFKGIENVLALNSTFLVELSSRLENWHPNRRVGDLFSAFDTFLDQYTAYIQNYTEAVRVLKRAQRKKKPFKDFLIKQKQDPRAKQRELDQFLIMPVQRIPRYNLLLRELVKHTWRDHPDLAALDAAIERLSNIAIYLNEKKRDAEALQRTFHVQDVLDHASVGLLVTAAERKYVFEGELFDANGKQVVAYLFNDVLVVCTDRNDRQHTEADERRVNRKRIRFSDYFMLDHDSVVSNLAEADENGRPGVSVVFPQQKKALQLYAPNATVRAEWVNVLRSLLAKRVLLAAIGLSSDEASTSSPNLTRSSVGAVPSTASPNKRHSGRFSHMRQRSSASQPDVVTAEPERVVNPLFISDQLPSVNEDSPNAAPGSNAGSMRLTHKKKMPNVLSLLSPRGPKVEEAPTHAVGTMLERSEDTLPASARKDRPPRMRPLSYRAQTDPRDANPGVLVDDDSSEGGKPSRASSGSIRGKVIMRLTNLGKMMGKDGEEKSPRPSADLSGAAERAPPVERPASERPASERPPSERFANGFETPSPSGTPDATNTPDSTDRLLNRDLEKLAKLMRGRGNTRTRDAEYVPDVKTLKPSSDEGSAPSVEQSEEEK